MIFLEYHKNFLKEHVIALVTFIEEIRRQFVTCVKTLERFASRTIKDKLHEEVILYHLAQLLRFSKVTEKTMSQRHVKEATLSSTEFASFSQQQVPTEILLPIPLLRKKRLTRPSTQLSKVPSQSTYC